MLKRVGCEGVGDNDGFFEIGQAGSNSASVLCYMKECYLCKDAGLEKDEYTQQEGEAGQDTDKGWICDDCRDVLHEDNTERFII